MINESLQNTIQEHMKKLPEGVQQAIRLSGWDRKILDIGRRYGLHVDQMEILQTELSLAILGLSKREEFVQEVKHEAGIPTEQLNEIIGDINHQIFEPIRTSLRKFQEAEQTREETQVSLSGLEKKEEDILRSHGFDFDDTTKQATSISSEGRLPQTKQDQTVVLDPIQSSVALESETKGPLRLDSGALGSAVQNNSLNINDLMRLGQEYEDDSQSETQELVSEDPLENQKEQTKEITGDTIDISKLKSAQTSDHQHIISASGMSGYGTNDPYREPIE